MTYLPPICFWSRAKLPSFCTLIELQPHSPFFELPASHKCSLSWDVARQLTAPLTSERALLSRAAPPPLQSYRANILKPQPSTLSPADLIRWLYRSSGPFEPLVQWWASSLSPTHLWYMAPVCRTASMVDALCDFQIEPQSIVAVRKAS